MSSSGLRKVRFKAMGGVTGIAGVTFAMGAGAQGSIAADGVYTPPAFVTAPANDQVLVTAPDGSQAQAVISLFP